MSANQSSSNPGIERGSAPGFLRRMVVILYDGLLLLAVWFVATALVLPFNGGQAFQSGQFGYPTYLLLVSFVFYTWFWIHGGQTLGLRSWKIKLISVDGIRVTKRQAALRFFAACISWLCFGLGFFWCLWDKQGLCWHDYWSKTRLYRLPQQKG